MKVGDKVMSMIRKCMYFLKEHILPGESYPAKIPWNTCFLVRLS